MSISVVFPDELLVAAREDEATFSRNVLIYTLGHLYTQGKISSGIAAQILTCDRWEVYRLFSAYGFAVIDHTPEELDEEARTSRELAAR